jgi:hypothetical protein
VFESIDLERKGHAFLGHALHSIMIQVSFFKTWGLLVSKYAEFNIKFKNIN